VNFNHVIRTSNKLANILANQGLLSTKSMVALSWPEMPLNRLKVQCHDQVDEGIMVFRNKVIEVGPS